MKRWKVWASIAAIFISGLLIGSAGTALYIKRAMVRILDGGPPEVRRVVMRKIARELNLTASQMAPVEVVVRATQERLIQVRLRNEPVIAGIVQEGAEEMKRCLDPPQRARLDGLLENARARWMLSEKAKDPGGKKTIEAR